MSYKEESLSWWNLQRNGFKVIVIALITGFALSTTVVLVDISHGMTLSSIATHVDCIAIFMGTIQFMCP